MKNKKDTGWGNVAAWYDELLQGEGTYQKEVILPHLLRLVAPKKDKRILDIGCGQGFFAFAFAEAGASVVGVDIAPELIKKAEVQKSKHKELDVSFHTASAASLPLKDDTYDAAIFVLSLQNMKEYFEAVAEAARTLKKGGEMFIVLNHPAFRIPAASSWGFDTEGGVQYRRIDRYALPFETKIDMTPGAKSAKEKKFTVSFHRPLQEYVKALAKAEFVITGLEEWHSHKTSEKGPRAEAEDRARKEFPLFLMVRAEKR